MLKQTTGGFMTKTPITVYGKSWEFRLQHISWILKVSPKWSTKAKTLKNPNQISNASIYKPRAPMTSMFEGQPPQNKAQTPIKQGAPFGL